MSFISYAQNYEDVMLWRALGYVGQGFYIDVGANDPEGDSVTKAFYDRGWNGINIEPMAEHFAQLKAGRPHDINLQAAVGDTQGEVTLYAPDIRGWATVATEVAQRHDRQNTPMHTSRVPLMRLDEICAQYAPRDIHFLKIDVEGYEKQVLAGMDFTRFRPWIVIVEAINPQQNNLADKTWEAPLLENRYRSVYFDGLNRFYLAEEHNALAAAFREPPNVFDEFTRLETISAKQALADAQAQLADARNQLDAALARFAAFRTESEATLSAAQNETARLAAMNGEVRAELAALRNSRSWKLTRPLRRAGELARAVKRLLAGPATAATTEIVPDATRKTEAVPPPGTATVPAILQPPAVGVRCPTRLHPASLYHPLATPEASRFAPANTANSPRWFRLTGHAEGHYSLAVVNRGILRALSIAHPQHVSLNPRDGESTTLSVSAPHWLRQLAAAKLPPESAGTTCSIVHHYPLISDPLAAGLRLALFFWEETAVPSAMVGHLEAHFDALLVASRFVKRALRNSGCSLPIAVIPMGVDHLIDADVSASEPKAPAAIFRFLHVSSAFERKGPDLLLKAWLTRFTGNDPVELYIKTFPNPHNRIHALWSELAAAHPNPPRIVIDEDALDDEQMHVLYRSAHAMVLPTRGEGFNLPAAEAMALGIPLLVTGHGAHTDFCNLDTAALIPFLFAPSASHLKTGESCWAEPDLQSLAEQLGILHQEIRTGSPALRRRREAAMNHVQQTYTWEKSAKAIDRFAAVLNEHPQLARKTSPCANEQIGLHLVSSWNTACGIAEYTRGLISAVRPETFRIHIDCDTRTPPSNEYHGALTYAPSWQLGDASSVQRVLQRVGERGQPGDIVLVQHQPGLFRLDTAVCEQLRILSRQGFAVLLEMHATRPLLDHQRPSLDALAALQALDRIIVHHVDDLNHLLMLGLDANLMLLPHGVTDPLPANEAATRSSLGLPDDALILASFGFLHPHKGVDQIIAALPAIARQTGRNVCLLAVNALPDPAHTQLLEQYRHLAAAQGVAENVRWLTGYQDIGQSLRQLACADFILFPYANTQESASGAVTIGLATGRPVLVSNQPIFADLDGIAWRMNGHDAAAIAEAVCALQADPNLEEALQTRQQDWLRQRSWQNISTRLAGTLLGFHRDKFLAERLGPQPEPTSAQARQPQLLVDVSELYHRDARTGIQRVVRNILRGLQQGTALPHLASYRTLPVFGTPKEGYRHTRRFDLAGIPADGSPTENQNVELEAGDSFLGLDLGAHLFPEAEDWLRDYRRRGVAVHFVVYDIIPLLHPQWTVPGMPEAFAAWLLAIARQSHRLLCISATVAADVRNWLIRNAPEQPVPDVVHFHLGADILPQSANAAETKAAPLPDLPGRKIFLSVGTIEPRKGQAQTLAAFEQLWQEGEDAVLVLVGKAGWMMDEFVDRLARHPENGRRLFWLQGIGDAELDDVYRRATALIAASEAEGFGLPLIEAARHGLPIIARNIAVFREVAGKHAFYFAGESASSLARSIRYWETLRQHGQHPRPDGLGWLSWQESAQSLQALLRQSRTQ